MMKKKIIITMMLLLMMTIIPIDKCYAGVGISVGVDLSDEGETEKEYDKKGNPYASIDNFTPSNPEENTTYTCKFSYKFDYDHDSEIDVFNKKNESIVYEEDDEIKFSEEILAGTSVGMQIHETKTISWDVYEAVVTATKTTTKPECTGGWKCTKWITPNFCPIQMASIFGLKIPFLKIVTQCPPEEINCTCGSSGCTSTCKKYEDVETTEPAEVTEAMESECKSAGESELLALAQANMHSSYIVKLRNANYVDAGIANTDSASEERIVEEVSANSCGFPSDAKSATCHYYYNVSSTCMNVKTGKVRYITNNSSCNSSDEIQIEKNGNTWQYFVPLDTKTNDTFGISLVYKDQKEPQSVEYCKKVIDAKSNYWDYIKDVNNQPLPRTEREALANIERTGGCTLDTEVVFDIEQKFYNEVDNGTAFKGFNIYYKPIDVNNPFPNGIVDTSIWKEWETSGTPALTGTSLNKDDITYIANVKDSKAIREYANKTTNNKKNSYTSWQNMFIDGRSGFIENEGFVIRYIQRDDFYKLGCGPANAKEKNSDGSTNYLYQSECGTQ